MSARKASVLLIACGALARELRDLQRLNKWEHVDLQCLPAELHNRPEKIPAAVRAKLEAARDRYARIFVAYADCGTGGRLDALLQEYGVERLPGAHCYEFYTGSDRFAELGEAELGTFYLTDFMVRHFDRIVYRGLGLDRNPHLLSDYFGNYQRVVYLAQVDSPELRAKAAQCARRLGLSFEVHQTGLKQVEEELRIVLDGDSRCRSS